MDEMMEICGEWMNKNTGQKIHVRNSIIDGDQMIIITNIGHMSMEEFSRNYIQASNEIYNENGQVIGNENDNMQHQQKSINDINIETINDQEYLIDDKPVKFDIAKQSTISIEQLPIKQSQINNIDLIKKVFSKIDYKPEITVEIKWDDFPKEQISTLVNFLDVDVDDISKYLYSEYVNVDTVKEKINEIINKNI